MHKQGKAIGSGTADPEQAPAAAASVPPTSVANEPAPGLKGPKGMLPRTSYSRVNTGSPPVPDARASAQKNSPPRGLEFLPRKTAHVEVHMSGIQQRPTLQDMLKAAMAGTLSKVDITKEANLQAANQGEETEEDKTASAEPGHIPTEQVEKLASAMDFIAIKVAEEATRTDGPGQGPGALDVSAAKASEENIDAGGMGTATAKHVPPKSPPIQTERTQSGKANTGLEDNTPMSHPEQPVDPWGNEKGKVSSAQVDRLLKIAAHEPGHLPPALAKKKIPKGSEDGRKMFGKGKAKQSMGYGGMSHLASAPIELIRQASSQLKTAEDAINPAQISPGKAVPPDASASEEGVPPQPSDVTKQQKLVGANLAAIGYTKRDAKADPKSDVNKVLTEPAQTKSTDSTLDKVLDHTDEAGAKISSADIEKVSAVRALLMKLSMKHEDEKKKNKKEKESQVDPTPQGSLGTGMTAATLGPGLSR